MQSPADAGGQVSLEQWLERNGRGALARLARDTNIDYHQLRRYVKGFAVPQFKAAAAISAATSGQVSAMSLVSRVRVRAAAKKRARRRAA